jgi:DNA polymerase-1
MNKQRKKLIIIDGNALIHRSFHALPPTLRTKDGLLVNAVYGFSAFLLKALNEFKPEYIILTLDKAGPTFRHEAYAEYKATRVKGVDELYAQIPLVKEVASTFGIPIFEKSGYEADDIIGSLTRQAKHEKDLDTIIVTGDLDTLQLISDQAYVYTMSRGLSDSVIYNADKVKERYELSPKQIVDYKALAGDDLKDFVDLELFPYLKKFKNPNQDPNTLEYKIGEIFGEIKNKIQSGYTLRNIFDIVDSMRFRSQVEKHELSRKKLYDMIWEKPITHLAKELDTPAYPQINNAYVI